MSKTLEIFTDGACRGNPGPAAIGVVLKHNGKTVGEISKEIGESTNNIAEYIAVIYALQEGLIQKADNLKISTDSELLYNQVTGSYKIKNPNIKLLFGQIKHLLKGFKRVEFHHVPREKNKEADRLASKAIKKEQTKVVASVFIAGEKSPSSKG